MRLILLIAALVATTSFGQQSPERIRKDAIKFGIGANAIDKEIEFDIGAGASNPKFFYDITNSKFVATEGGMSFEGGVELTETGAGTDTLTLVAPAALTTSTTWEMPDGNGTAGYALVTDGASPTAILSWQPVVTDPTTTDGDLIYRNTTLQRLPVGAANSVLISNGTLPSWTISPTFGGDTSVLGELAVGLASPSNRLHVQDNQALYAAFIDQGNSSGHGINVDIAGATSGQVVLNATSNNGGNSVIYARGDGFIGFGTSSPQEMIHILENQNAATSVRIENTNTGGNAATRVDFIGDATTGALFKTSDTGDTGRLVLRNNGFDLTLLPDGFIGNLAAPLFPFHIEKSVAGQVARIQNLGGSAGDDGLGVRTTSNAAGTNIISARASGVQHFKVQGDGITFIRMDAGPYATDVCANGASGLQQLGTCTSSSKFKKEISDIDQSLVSKLYQIRGVKFKWKGNDKDDFGLVAEEVAALFPRLAFMDDQGNVKGVNYRHMVGLIIEALKSQKALIDSMETRISSLEARP